MDSIFFKEERAFQVTFPIKLIIRGPARDFLWQPARCKQHLVTTSKISGYNDIKAHYNFDLVPCIEKKDDILTDVNIWKIET